MYVCTPINLSNLIHHYKTIKQNFHNFIGFNRMGSVHSQKQIDCSIINFPLRDRKQTRERILLGLDQDSDYVVFWDHIIQIGRFKERKSRRKQFTYEELSKAPCKFIEMIKKDIPRTFPKEKYLKNQENRESLSRVLVALSNRFPEIGYFSGMNFYVCRILKVASQEDAFWIVVWFFFRDRLIYNTLTSKKSMQTLFEIVTEIMQRETPHLSKVMKHIGVGYQVFVLTWIKTWFSLFWESDVFYIIISLVMLEGPWVWIVAISSMITCLESNILKSNRSQEMLLQMASGKTPIQSPTIIKQFKVLLAKGLEKDGKMYLDRIQNLVHLDVEVQVTRNIS